MERASGVLMAISSLPSPYGIGTIGKEAYRFADFLKRAGQSVWQILPVGPISYGDSPYQSFSTYAGNPYLIDLDLLFEDGLLKKADYRDIDWGNNEEYVEYHKLYENRFAVLHIAYKNHKKKDQTAFERFISANGHWLEDYALYMAVKRSFGMVSWTDWPDEDIRLHKPQAVQAYKEKLSDDIRFYMFMQYKFFEQWEKFRAYVNSLGISLFGDMPIYVAMDSADTWANPKVFWLDENNLPVRVAGCPPDYFSATGQLWGNPLYDWDYLKQSGYAWWIERVKAATALFDLTRIDHFRGFDEYYSIPYGAKDAVVGDWLPGPGMDLFNALEDALGKDLPIIAEDLGLITEGVETLLKDTGYPGMKVMQFAFDDRGESVYLPHMHTDNYVVYTGTHDNDTTMGWFAAASEGERAFATEYCRLSEDEGFNWGLIRAGQASVAKLFIAPMQDYLGLGSTARMNIPSTIGGNWAWRMKKDAISLPLIQRMHKLSRLYARIPKGFEQESPLLAELKALALLQYRLPLQQLTAQQLNMVLGKAVLAKLQGRWQATNENRADHRRAYYFSAEYLMGRMVYNNLQAMELLGQVKALFEDIGIDILLLEDVEDAALGNGGLGRLAACFLDCAATQDVPLDGYGLRYTYGLFKQAIENGFQVELPDDWQQGGDPWSVRREDERQLVSFAGSSLWAVPYDMPIIGTGTGTVSTLRLWQAEPLQAFDFSAFNRLDYGAAFRQEQDAKVINACLYPNDDGPEGKRLRLKQQYFFCSASIKDILAKYKQEHGSDYSLLHKFTAIQLNDTHPIVAIPELIRLLMQDGLAFEAAFAIAQKIFNFTNHTIMAEALESWDVALFSALLPEVYGVIEQIQALLLAQLSGAPGMDVPLPGQKTKKALQAERAALQSALEEEQAKGRRRSPKKMAQLRAQMDGLPTAPRTVLDSLCIIDEGRIRMANLAIFAGSKVNGVAQIHSDILKAETFQHWYALYPERFSNKTNGITQRRWLRLCNEELSALVTEKIGDGWIRDLGKISELKDCIDDGTIQRLIQIKHEKKRQLADYIKRHENGFAVNPDHVFDVQIKRLHEYKRQLLNAFSILDIYRRTKDGSLSMLPPTVFLIGAKAAPGYKRAKAIIKYISEVAALVNGDPAMEGKLKVLFVQNYNCSYAEKLIPAADISEQISAVGTEASGTGNMKLMLNGAVTLGTFDGANIEIAEEAGEENNFLFGEKLDAVAAIKENYDPMAIYQADERIRSLVDSLIDGSFTDGGTGDFAELHDALLKGASWHTPDHYMLLHDLPAYVARKEEAIKATRDQEAFARMSLHNIACAGKFSADRTILEYAKEIWEV